DRQGLGWLQLGGLPFLLTTCRMNVFLFRVPAALLAAYLPLSLFGLIGLRGSTGCRLLASSTSYLLLFSFAAQAFTHSCALLFAPFVALGFAWRLPALRGLWQALRTTDYSVAARSASVAVE